MPLTPIELFTHASDRVVKFEVSFNKLRGEDRNAFYFEVLKSELKMLWEKTKKCYDKCLEDLQSSKDTDPEDIQAIESKFENIMDVYARCLQSIHLKIEELEAKTKPKLSPSMDTDPNSDNFCHHLPLPPCDTDMFSGDYLSWPTFRDLFTALYINNKRLSNIERLCYLVRRTDKEAREIVSKCPLTNQGFDIAWKNLKDVYENPRMLVNNQLKELFELETIVTETSSSLKNLQRGINGFLTAMDIYEIPTQNWDPFIVFICIQRLPSQTVTLWEQTVKDKTAISLWKDLDMFLTERIQTLVCIRDLTSSGTDKKGKERKVKAHVSNTSTSSACVLCHKPGHLLRFCRQFKKMSVSERYNTVKKHHFCVNCFAPTHEAKDCKSEYSCSICKKRHHTLLHREKPKGNYQSPSTDNSNVVPVASQSESISLEPSTSAAALANLNRQVFHISQNSSVLLGTAMVSILCNDTTYPARALIDPASEASFISEHLRNQLRLPSHSTNVTISGIHKKSSTTSRKCCIVRIGSPIDRGIDLETSAFVLPSISGNLPSFSCPSDIKGEIPNLRLADRNFYKSRAVDLLLGADLYPRIILDEIRSNIVGSLMAQKTVFGWVLTGPINSMPKNSISVFTTTINYTEEENLNQNLLKFWELEEPPKRKNLSPSDRRCEEIYRDTTKRDSKGRYIVSLPFKPEFPQEINLGISKTGVLKQFIRMETSLMRKPEVRRMYDEVLKEYLELDHMRPIGTDDLAVTQLCYLPHLPVLKPESKTTKLRVVFNASNKTSNGHSLNDCLFVGPTLQADLVILILRWRLFKFVFNCDISKMYRQIRVHSSHTPFQRILYRSSAEDEIREYELQTVTFGLNCAPYLAIRTLLQLADDCEQNFPLASKILRESMYVDDVLTGAHDISSALIARDQLVRALSSAGFELRKWTSNDKSILVGLAIEHLVDAKLLTFVESSSSKTLGIFWNAQLDSFYFRVCPLAVKSSYTKREVLSTIAKFFDPVGWLSPVIIMAKVIMQRIWKDKIGWDDFLPAPTREEWLKFVDLFDKVNLIKIPRWVNYSKDSTTELHIFSDSSEKAYAGVIYIRVESSCGEISTHILSSKTKVAPLKSISLPRLELCGAVLASELLKNVVREIQIPIKQVYCWTDSTIVLAWLAKPPCTWTTFVANRVSRIQENTGSNNWFHVSSADNPADLGSRGVDPLILSRSKLWWHGPSWLSQDKSKWESRNLKDLNIDLETRKVKTNVTFFTHYEDVLERFSSLPKALRVIAYIIRFFNSCHPARKGQFIYETKRISCSELKMAKLRLVVVAQKAFYAEEYGCLLEKKPLPPKSSLIPMNPFLDERKVMRLNGRLVKSPSLSYREQYPIILPYRCRFAKLNAELVHRLTIHGGNELMLRIYRCEYWVPRLRTLVRTVVHHCKRCIIDRKRSCSQIMAALPQERTNIGRPFTTTGVDFAGPFDVKTFTSRSCRITKGYVCVFVCFSTKAIHLEATSDLSTDSFMAAFDRFISRRGCPQTIFSDNGTNFVGASNEIFRNFQTFLKECEARMCSKVGYEGLSWKFIPAGAPHMGGLWEAGVKSFKLHFRKEVQNCKYTFEELSTILARIEACLNSRPLCPMPDNPNEPIALTPGHFLIGSAILAPPEPTIYENSISIVNRYRKMKALIHQFCKRWKEEYLVTLHKRYKWQHPQRDVSVNDLVVLRNEQLPATSWKIGRVVKIYKGTDGHVRVVDVRTSSGIVNRPITKLVVLPS